MVLEKQITEIYWLTEHLFFREDWSNFGGQWLSGNRGWITVEMIWMEWTWETFGSLTASEYKLTSWGAWSSRVDWKKIHRWNVTKTQKKSFSCERRQQQKKKTKSKAKGSGLSIKRNNQTKKAESEMVWIRDTHKISMLRINKHINQRCWDDWAAWGSGRLAKVVRGSRGGGVWGGGVGRVRTVSRWRQAGSFLGDGKQEEGNRKGLEGGGGRDSERLYLGGNHFRVAA